MIDPTLAYSTYLGGSSGDTASGVAVDSSGNAYIGGSTTSTDFPTQDASQSGYGGGVADAFVAKLNSSGTALVYSTYLGGDDADDASGIAVDGSGSAYVTGGTTSSNFPTTPNAFRRQVPIGGGPGSNSTVSYVTKLKPTGTLAYSTLVGTGAASGSGDDIAVDGDGNAYITGNTSGTAFPTTPGAYQFSFGGGASDVFIAKVDPAGSRLVYASYLGGTGNDYAGGIAVDGNRNAYVTGTTVPFLVPDTGFPAKNAIQTSRSGNQDAFVTKFSPDGSDLVYSTYLGGDSSDEGFGIATDGEQRICDRRNWIF